MRGVDGEFWGFQRGIQGVRREFRTLSGSSEADLEERFRTAKYGGWKTRRHCDAAGLGETENLETGQPTGKGTFKW